MRSALYLGRPTPKSHLWQCGNSEARRATVSLPSGSLGNHFLSRPVASPTLTLQHRVGLLVKRGPVG